MPNVILNNCIFRVLSRKRQRFCRDANPLCSSNPVGTPTSIPQFLGDVWCPTLVEQPGRPATRLPNQAVWNETRIRQGRWRRRRRPRFRCLRSKQIFPATTPWDSRCSGLDYTDLLAGSVVVAIQFRCPKCDRRLSIASRKAGIQVTCPNCERPVTVPDANPAPALAASSSLTPRTERRYPPVAGFVAIMVLAVGIAAGFSFRKQARTADQSRVDPLPATAPTPPTTIPSHLPQPDPQQPTTDTKTARSSTSTAAFAPSRAAHRVFSTPNPIGTAIRVATRAAQQGTAAPTRRARA